MKVVFRFPADTTWKKPDKNISRAKGSSIIPYQPVIADFTHCDFFLLLLSCVDKLPWLSSKLCLLHCPVNSLVSASSVAPQGTPGAPGAPGSPGPQGKQGDLGPPVSLASRPSNHLTCWAQAHTQTGSHVSQAEQLPVRQILFLMPQPADCTSANGNATVREFPSHLGRRRVGQKRRYLH